MMLESLFYRIRKLSHLCLGGSGSALKMRIRIQGVEMKSKVRKKYFCYICIVGSSVVDLEYVSGSVADPDPNPGPDPRVFGPPGSGSTGQRNGSGSGSGSCSGSGSFYHHAKIVRKTLIPTIL